MLRLKAESWTSDCHCKKIIFYEVVDIQILEET